MLKNVWLIAVLKRVLISNEKENFLRNFRFLGLIYYFNLVFDK